MDLQRKFNRVVALHNKTIAITLSELRCFQWSRNDYIRLGGKWPKRTFNYIPNKGWSKGTPKGSKKDIRSQTSKRQHTVEVCYKQNRKEVTTNSEEHFFNTWSSWSSKRPKYQRLGIHLAICSIELRKKDIVGYINPDPKNDAPAPGSCRILVQQGKWTAEWSYN